MVLDSQLEVHLILVCNLSKRLIRIQLKTFRSLHRSLFIVHISISIPLFRTFVGLMRRRYRPAANLLGSNVRSVSEVLDVMHRGY